MDLRDHPGFFGITSQGVIAIHADWPIYPEEHGPDLALIWLTAFPPRTAFKSIDDIDRCCLLLADVQGSNHKQPFSERNFHVAIWHEDLIDLQNSAFVRGVEGTLTERQWYERFLSSLPPGPYFIKLADGTMKEIELPSEIERDNDFPYAAQIARDGVLVSESGLTRAASLLANMGDDFDVHGTRVRHLLDLGYYDTAVREACVGVESQIKNAIESSSWGDTLADEFIAKLRSADWMLENRLRVLRGQIRMALKFIRNDFMHNFVHIGEPQCKAILFRVARVREAVNSVSSLLK
jgi:hypothetical protein